MASDPLSMRTYIGSKISPQFCCRPLKQENNMNNKEMCSFFKVTENQENYYS